MSTNAMKKLIEYQFIIVYMMKFLGAIGIAGCVAEGHPYASAFILSTAAGLVELNIYINKNKNDKNS